MLTYYHLKNIKDIPFVSGIYVFKVVSNDNLEVFTYVGRSHCIRQRVTLSHLQLKRTLKEYGSNVYVGVFETADISIEKSCVRLLSPIYNFWPSVNPILSSKRIHESYNDILFRIFGEDLVYKLMRKEAL